MSSRIHDFWSGALSAPLVVLSDFDFTISQVDVGDLITMTLCPPSAETVRRVRAGEAGSRVWYLDSMVRVDLPKAEALADAAAIDPAFPPFVQWCQQQSLPLAVVSDGFGLYISRIFRREGLSHLPVFCNEMPEPGRLAWPNANPVCDRCACCKPNVARRLREHGIRVVYVGDGTSDMYASAFADWVFAKGDLADFLQEQGSPFFPFDSFADVQAKLAGALPEFRSGRAPGRVTLSPSPHCRF
ncbi:MAG TPA: MtnX-like HAD-IB family phosphatase [Symbiobacteriaceae bacterium]|nr:MtnX-like HAD-IB family phosphatase [Symbiobacteriaceae bacterium]